MTSRNDHQANKTVSTQAAFNDRTFCEAKAVFRRTLLNDPDRAMRTAREFIATDSVGGVPEF